MSDRSDDLRARRKARNDASEINLQNVFSDFSKSPEDHAAEGLMILGAKVTEDLNEQFDEVRRRGSTDRELARLLRMLEKRKKALDTMYEAAAPDEGLMSAANAMIVGWDQCEN